MMKRFLARSHRRALELAIESQVEGISDPQSEWLQKHVTVCSSCKENQKTIIQAAEGLRSVSATARAQMVRATQLRVRARAQEMDRRKEENHPLWVFSALAIGWALLTTPLLWEGVTWASQQMNAPVLMLQAGFAVAWLTPTTLIAAAALWHREKGQRRTH